MNYQINSSICILHAQMNNCINSLLYNFYARVRVWQPDAFRDVWLVHTTSRPQPPPREGDTVQVPARLQLSGMSYTCIVLITKSGLISIRPSIRRSSVSM